MNEDWKEDWTEDCWDSGDKNKNNSVSTKQRNKTQTKNQKHSSIQNLCVAKHGDSSSALSKDSVIATIVATYGRQFLVELAEQPGLPIDCIARGRKQNLVVGDRVYVQKTPEGQSVIEEVLPRHNVLYRSDQFKSRLFAANIDQLFIMLATQPSFSEEFLGRALVSAETEHVVPIIILNKTDIASALPASQATLQLYKTLGYTTLEISVQNNPAAALQTILPYLEGKTSVLLGQSGMGKSSLVNLLAPHAAMETREISTALNSGKHTTTFSRLFHIKNTFPIQNEMRLQ